MPYNESDTRSKLIDPAIFARGWKEADAAIEGASQRLGLGDVALDDIDSGGEQDAGALGGAHQRPHGEALGVEPFNDGPPEHTGRANDENTVSL